VNSEEGANSEEEGATAATKERARPNKWPICRSGVT